MSSKWKGYKFSDLCTISRGASPRPIKDFISLEGVPWVKIADATSSNSRFIEQTNEKIKLDGVPKSKVVYPGDLILSNSATPGLPKFMKIEACIHDGWMLLRDFKGLNKKFAYWLLLHERRNIVVQGNGSVFTNLKTEILKNHIVKIPNEKQQEKIANKLDSLQDKIELNRQTNQTLESIAQAIFKSWFVDFDPVKAKMSVLEAGGSAEDVELAAMAMIVTKSPEELAEFKQTHPKDYKKLAQTAALFPSAMQKSELGEIPEGWEVRALDEIAHYQNGLALQNYRPKGTDFLPVLKISQLKKGFADGKEKASSDIRTECIVNNGDVVFSWSGSLLVDIWCGGKVALNQHLFKVTSDDYPKWLYYYFTKYHLSEFQRIAVDKAVTMGHIKREHLSRAKCVLPDNDDCLIKLGYVIEILLDKQKEQRLESIIFSNLRDSLLPKLLSGELAVEVSA